MYVYCFNHTLQPLCAIDRLKVRPDNQSTDSDVNCMCVCAQYVVENWYISLQSIDQLANRHVHQYVDCM